MDPAGCLCFPRETSGTHIQRLGWEPSAGRSKKFHQNAKSNQRPFDWQTRALTTRPRRHLTPVQAPTEWRWCAWIYLQHFIFHIVLTGGGDKAYRGFLELLGSDSWNRLFLDPRAAQPWLAELNSQLSFFIPHWWDILLEKSFFPFQCLIKRHKIYTVCRLLHLPQTCRHIVWVLWTMPCRHISSSYCSFY